MFDPSVIWPVRKRPSWRNTEPPRPKAVLMVIPLNARTAQSAFFSLVFPPTRSWFTFGRFGRPNAANAKIQDLQTSLFDYDNLYVSLAFYDSDADSMFLAEKLQIDGSMPDTEVSKVEALNTFGESRMVKVDP